MAASVRILQNGLNFGLRTLQRNLRTQVLVGLAAQRCFVPTRMSSTSTVVNEVRAKTQEKVEGNQLLSVRESNDQVLHLTFGDNSEGATPFLWLRDNCQCSDCYDSMTLNRKQLMRDFNPEIKPDQINFDGGSLSIIWSDSHTSTYDADWLHKRAFSATTKQNYQKLHRLPQEPWGKGVQIKKFDYEDLMKNDKELLKWLMAMEIEGVSLVRNTPNDPDAGPKFGEHIAYIKRTHYGRSCSVFTRENPNNLAFRSASLSLHVDAPYYENVPGIALLHLLKQHEGKGGETTISDGLFCGEFMRRHHPKEFELLTRRSVYYFDKGAPSLPTETYFYKIGKGQVIKLDNDGRIEEVRYSNQMRDSFIDIDATQVNDFFKALKVFDDILYENSYTFKMMDGEMCTVDNVRCLHGREEYESSSSRHLESSYLDWDEAKCLRRRLMEKTKNS